MKSIYRLLSTLLLCLPLLYISWLWDRLPTRLPVHFADDGLPDRYASRQEWFSGLLNVMFALVLIRGVLIALLSRQFDVQGGRFARIYMLSAAFVGSILGLIVLRTIHGSSLYTDLLPVLMALFGAAGVYFTVPTVLPTADETTKPTLTPPQLTALQHMHTLSRSTVIRVNLLAGLLMLFARSEDRWTIGIMANLLAFVALFAIGIVRRQSG